MKALFVGDVHNHHYIFDDIQRLDKQYNFDRIIFVGDYVDDWNTTNHESLITLNKIFELKNEDPDKYTLCIGNHELSYMGYPCSGHKYELGEVVEDKLKENNHLLDFYTEVELNDKKFICTHAGLVNEYVLNELDSYGDCIKVLAEMNKNKKLNLPLLTQCSYFRGGNSPYSSFLWADRREMFSLLYDNEELVVPYQIIGHSPVKTVEVHKSDTYEIYYIDTHSTYQDGTEYGDKSYLLWNENKFEIVK